MFSSLTLNVDENVIKIYYYKNVEFLYQDFINIALKRSLCIGQTKRYYLVLKVAVIYLKSRLPFIAFSYSYSMIGID